MSHDDHLEHATASGDADDQVAHDLLTWKCHQLTDDYLRRNDPILFGLGALEERQANLAAARKAGTIQRRPHCLQRGRAPRRRSRRRRATRSSRGDPDPGEADAPPFGRHR